MSGLASGFGFRISGFASGFGFVFGFRASDFGFGLGFRVSGCVVSGFSVEEYLSVGQTESKASSLSTRQLMQ
jgi:hypothetical protein